MVPTFSLGVPIEPPLGQRCKGRNYGERRCCSPENPCDEGEGDCDGPGDGVPNDGNRGCKPGRKKEGTFLIEFQCLIVISFQGSYYNTFQINPKNESTQDVTCLRGGIIKFKVFLRICVPS